MRLAFHGVVVFLVLLLAISVNSFVSFVQAAVVWDESTGGDFSDNRNAPTSVPLSAGSNSILGKIGEEIGQSDLDYYTINVPADHTLSALILADYQSDDGLAFLGIQTGTQMTVAPTTPSAAGLLGWSHFGSNGATGIGGDLLPELGTSGFGATGFTPPLPSGSYTFWLQAFDGLPVDYQFDFVIDPPATANLPDYNGNLVVDAADYTTWRDSLGHTGAGLAADGIVDEKIDSLDYDFWKLHFSETVTPGSGSAAPEPGSSLLAAAGLLSMFNLRRKRR